MAQRAQWKRQWLVDLLMLLVLMLMQASCCSRSATTTTVAVRSTSTAAVDGLNGNGRAGGTGRCPRGHTERAGVEQLRMGGVVQQLLTMMRAGRRRGAVVAVMVNWSDRGGDST